MYTLCHWKISHRLGINFFAASNKQSKVKFVQKKEEREELEKAALTEQSLTTAGLLFYDSNAQCLDTTIKNSTLKKLRFYSTMKNSTMKKTVQYFVAPFQFYVQPWISWRCSQ